MKKIYYSWWSAEDKNLLGAEAAHRLSLDAKLIGIISNSVHLMKLVYPKSEIILITDSLGKDFFSNYKIFDKIMPGLDSLPKEYKEVWSLGKIKSYDIICDLGEPFLHLDFDVFISAPFPKELLLSSIFVQGKDYCGFEPWTDPYLVSTFFKLVEDKPDFINYQYSFDHMYNMAIFGGSNIGLIKEYASKTLKMVLSPNNKAYFATPYKELSLLHPYKACVAEQYSLGSFLAYKNMHPKRFLPDGFCTHCQLETSLHEYNYVHLPAGLKDLGDEYFKKCLNRIGTKVVWPPRKIR